MAYTDAQVDALISSLQKQIDTKATKGELSAHSAQNTTQIQALINDTTDITTINNQQASLLSTLATRITSKSTRSLSAVFLAPESGLFSAFNPPHSGAIVEVNGYIDSGSAEINITNNGVNIIASDLTLTTGAWAEITTVTGNSFNTGNNIAMLVSGVTGAGFLTVQFDYTVG